MLKKDKYRPSHLAASSKDLEPKRKQKKNNSNKKCNSRYFRVALIIVIALALLAGMCYMVFSHFYSRMSISAGENWISSVLAENEEIISGEDLPSNMDWDYTVADVTNILLIGVDNDDAAGMDDRGNADGLMILSINKNTKQVVLSSLMRDVLATVPSEGYKTKLTLAYHYAGTQALIDTIEANFGIPIDNYVMVNYLCVIDLVDAVGGVELELTADEIYWMESKIKNLNILMGEAGDANIIDVSQAGTIQLNGIQTAALLRIRYAGDGDFDRTERARNVLMALADKVRDMKLTEIISLADRILPQVTTNLTQTQTMTLLLNTPKYLKYDMISNRIPIDDTWQYENNGNGSFVIIDFSINAEFLYRSIYEGANG